MKNSIFVALFAAFLITSCAYNDTSELTGKYNSEPYESVTLVDQVRTLPESILMHLEDQYPGKTISKVDASDSKYVINISNHTILEFNLNGELLGADYNNEDLISKITVPGELPNYVLDYIGEHYPGNSIINVNDKTDALVVELSQEVVIDFPK